MWTTENRARHDRRGLRYPSDPTDREWKRIGPLIPPANRDGNKRTVDVRSTVNGVTYVLSTGGRWAALPKDLPPRSTVNGNFRRWDWYGTLVHAADMQDRDGGVLLTSALFGLYPFPLKLYADSGYQGTKFRDGLAAACAQVGVLADRAAVSGTDGGRDRADHAHRVVSCGAREEPVLPFLAALLTALAFRATVDRPDRFRRSRDVGAHLALTPRRYQSGETDVQGRISRCGDELARTALYEAVQSPLIRGAEWSALRAWGMQFAVARKLAVILHRMWSDGSEFRRGKQRATKAAA